MDIVFICISVKMEHGSLYLRKIKYENTEKMSVNGIQSFITIMPSHLVLSNEDLFFWEMQALMDGNYMGYIKGLK